MMANILPIRSLQDHLRAVWKQDPDLNYWIPVSETAENRLFDEGLDPAGATFPLAIITDSGSTGQKNLGDHAIFEQRPFLVRIYAENRARLLDLSRRFRLVFSNVGGSTTEDGTILASRVTGGQMTRFPDGARMIQHTLTLSVAENRGPARLRATTETNRET